MDVLRRVVSGSASASTRSGPVRSARNRPSASPPTSSSAGRHEKLEENWETVDDPVEDGLVFFLKYLGNVIVDHPNGEGTTSSAVKKIVSMSRGKSRLNRKPLTKMEVFVSPRGIRMTEVESNVLFEEVSIYRVSFCTNDSTHSKVFAFIARNNDNETMECHAFLCPKKKVAQAITLSVSHSFNLAFENWEREKAKKKSAGASKSKTTPSPIQTGATSPTAQSSLPSRSVPSSQQVTSRIRSLNVSSSSPVRIAAPPPSTKNQGNASSSSTLTPTPTFSQCSSETRKKSSSKNPFLSNFVDEDDDDDVDFQFETLATSRTGKKLD